MPEEENKALARPGPVEVSGLERRSWQAILFVVLTTLLLALTVLALLFPGVLDSLQDLRAEGDLDRYAGLLALVIMLYCIYVLRMQAQLGRLRNRMVNEQVTRRSLEQLVAQLKRLVQVAATIHRRRKLEKTLQVLVAAAQESLEARSVVAVIHVGGEFGPVVTAGDTRLTTDQAKALAELVKESTEPIEAHGPAQLAALGVAPSSASALALQAPAETAALLAVPLRNPREGLGVLLAEFAAPGPPSGAVAVPQGGSPRHAGAGASLDVAGRPILSNSPPSLELDLLRVFAENAVIAIENDNLARQMEQMAVTDELTGLFNRRHFNRELEREMLRTDRTGRSFALLLMDLDHFKAINDTYGHDAGDEALRRVARALAAGTRKTNVLARYGGEEFVVILTETGAEGAVIAAEHLRKAIQNIAGPQKITLSVGVAVYPRHARTSEGLLKSADAALYAAKNAGRNQVCLAEAALPATG